MNEKKPGKKIKKSYLIYSAVIFAIIVVIFVLALGLKGDNKDKLTGAVVSDLNDYTLEQETDKTLDTGESAGTDVAGATTITDSETTTTTTTIPEPKITLADQTDIINKIILLREYSDKNDLGEAAVVFGELKNQFININLDDALLSDLSVCISSRCDDRKYFDLIDLVTLQNIDNSRNKLIRHVIKVYNLWNRKNEEKWLLALGEVHQLVKGINNKDITSKWNLVVKCNANCNEFSDLVFELVQEIDSV